MSYCLSLDENGSTLTFAVKLNGYCVDSDDNDLFSSIKEYYETCDTLPWKIDEGLVGKTLDIYEPHCLALSLKSIHNLDYVFEFLYMAPNSKLYCLVGVTLIDTNHLVAKVSPTPKALDEVKRSLVAEDCISSTSSSSEVTASIPSINQASTRNHWVAKTELCEEKVK
ncbi:hypothetical protein Tco_0245672 [Tanacetum coccineum]